MQLSNTLCTSAGEGNPLEQLLFMTSKSLQNIYKKMIQLESFDVTLILVFLVTVLTVKYVQSCLQGYFNSIPGPFGIPILGYFPFLMLTKNQLKKFQELRQKFGNIYSFAILNNKVVVISGKDEIKDAVARSDYFSDRPDGLAVQILGGGVGFAKFSPSYVLRKKIATSVLSKMYTHTSHSKLDEIFTSEASYICAEFRKHKGSPFDPEPHLYESIGHVIWQMCYGRGTSGRTDEAFKYLLENNRDFAEFTKAGNIFDAMPFLRHVMPNQFDYFINLLQRLIRDKDELIKKHKETFDPDDIRDLCDALINAENKLTSKQKESLQGFNLTFTLVDFVEAGFDTVTTTLHWAIMFLADNPEVQLHAQKQIDREISSSPTIAHLKNLPYIEAIILESLRLGVIVPLSVPHASTENVIFHGYHIPKNSTIFLNVYSVCFDEKLWNEPEKFKPERFLTKAGDIDKDMCEWIYVFGVGRRKCLGENFAKVEMFIFLTTFLQNFTFKKPMDEKYTLDGRYALTYRPQVYKVIVQDRL